MTRIAWLFEFAELNGAERSLLATFEGIRRLGFSPVAIAPSKGPLAELLRSAGIEHVPFDVRDGVGRRRKTPGLQRELLDHLIASNAELLHANSLSMGRLSGPVVSQIGLPSIAHMRDIYRLSGQAVSDLNQHARLLAVSEAVRTFHADGGVDASRIHVLYNGADLEVFCPGEPSGYIQRELGLPESALLFASIGQIGLRKGQDVLVEAFATVASRHPQVHLLIVGERHSQKDEAVRFAEQLALRARQPDLVGRVHFLGYREDVAKLLPDLRGLVHAARQEPLGRVLLEAAACGVPVIATDVGGTREIFPTEADGAILVEVDDVAALASAWLCLIDDDAQHSQLSAGARSRACEQFPVEKCVTDLAAHYGEVLNADTSS